VTNSWKDEKYIFVAMSHLLQLLAVCRACASPAVVTETLSTSPFMKGTYYAVDMVI
jgi:hypothetical protein